MVTTTSTNTSGTPPIFYTYNPVTFVLNGSSIGNPQNLTNGTYTKPQMNSSHSLVNVFSPSKNSWSLVETSYVTTNSPTSGNLVFKSIELDGNTIATSGLTFATIPANTPFTATIQLLNYEGGIRTDVNGVFTLYYFERESQNMFTLPVSFTEGSATFVFSFAVPGIYDLVNTNMQFASAVNSNSSPINVQIHKFIDLIYSTYGTVSVKLSSTQLAELLATYIQTNYVTASVPPVSAIISQIGQYTNVINIKTFSVYVS